MWGKREPFGEKETEKSEKNCDSEVQSWEREGRRRVQGKARKRESVSGIKKMACCS